NAEVIVDRVAALIAIDVRALTATIKANVAAFVKVRVEAHAKDLLSLDYGLVDVDVNALVRIRANIDVHVKAFVRVCARLLVRAKLIAGVRAL
ncbi:hypothetical protein BGZ76_002397, partial [Entomortierella beljakovae]